MGDTRDRFPLGWVGDFAASIKKFVHLRPAEELLILIPNQVYKLNGTAIRVLQLLFDGGDIEKFVAASGAGDRAREDLYYFFCDLKALVSGCLGDGQGRRAVEFTRFEAPFAHLPILSEIAVTYRCNLSCRFCYAGCSCHAGESPEMTTAEITRVLRIIRDEADVPSVSFTGGEPTLRRDLPELIATARDLGMRINLISNGTLITSALARELVDAGLNSAQISVEGPDAASHDALTAVRGSFERTWRGIAALRETGIVVQTNTTLCRGNAGRAAEIVDLIADRGLTRFAMNLLTPSGTAISTGSADLSLSYLDTGAVVEAAQRRAKERGITFFWYSPTPYCLFNPITSGLGNKSCAACDGLLSISPRGDVLPCSAFSEGVGNLLRQDFLEVWDSARAVWWREKKYLPAECAGCDTSLACAGACPLYWDAHGTGELRARLQEVHA